MSITPSIVATSSSGVAPLAVYFDASGSTSTATTNPFAELSYSWNFGDPSSGLYSPTGKSKNLAYGPLVAHVFESPGTYSVTLTIEDADGTIATDGVTITVTDPDTVFSGTNTICFSRTGDFTGAPAGSTQTTTTSFATVAAAFAAGKRILLRAGEVWPITTGVTLNKAGPGIISKFGSGAKPRFEMTAGSSFEPIFKLSATSGAVLDDWRLFDLDLDGQGTDGSRGVYCWGAGTNVLLMRLDIANCGDGVSAPLSQVQANNIPPMTGFTIYDCTVTDLASGSGGNLLGIAIRKLALLGSEILRSTNGEHVARFFWLQGAFVSNNLLSEAPFPRHVIKLMAPRFDQAGFTFNQYSENIVISDNLIDGVGGTQIAVDVGPENDTFDERIRTMIVERNYFTVGAAVQVALQLSGTDFAIRANVFNLDQTLSRDAMNIGKKAIEPSPGNITISQNTALSISSSGAQLAVIGTFGTGLWFYNNLVAGPDAKLVPVADEGFITDEQGNALGTAAAADFVGGTAPSSIAGFELNDGSIGAGVGVGTFAVPWDIELHPVAWGTGAPADDAGALQIQEPFLNAMFFGSR
jgi:hypothetical protein